MPSTADLQARVDRGMKLLDQRSPGWDLKINLEALDMSSGDRCILGQRFGSYEQGCYQLFGPTDSGGIKPAKHGFYTRAQYDANIYGRLERLWVKELERRQSVRASKDTDLATAGD